MLYKACVSSQALDLTADEGPLGQAGISQQRNAICHQLNR